VGLCYSTNGSMNYRCVATVIPNFWWRCQSWVCVLAYK